MHPHTGQSEDRQYGLLLLTLEGKLCVVRTQEASSTLLLPSCEYGSMARYFHRCSGGPIRAGSVLLRGKFTGR